MPALAALLLCAATLAVMAVAAPSHEEQSRFWAHLRRARKFHCEEPQPRSILSSELIQLGTSERVDPPYTVLHRCDASAGCCDSHDRHCQMKESANVTLVFLVANRVRGGVEYREATHANHTRCHCVSKELEPPK